MSEQEDRFAGCFATPEEARFFIKNLAEQDVLLGISFDPSFSASLGATEEVEFFSKTPAEQAALLDKNTPEELLTIGLDRSSFSIFYRLAALKRPKLSKETAAKVWEYIVGNPNEHWYLRFRGLAEDKIPLLKAMEIAVLAIYDRTEPTKFRLSLLSAMPPDLRQTYTQAILEADEPEMHQAIAQSATTKE